jgi:hypothetical protein
MKHRGCGSSRETRTCWFGGQITPRSKRKKDRIAKIDVQNMLKRCRVSNVEDTGGEEGWRAEGTDIDGRRIVAIVVPYEDDPPEIKVVTTWAHTP